MSNATAPCLPNEAVDAIERILSKNRKAEIIYAKAKDTIIVKEIARETAYKGRARP